MNSGPPGPKGAFHDSGRPGPCARRVVELVAAASLLHPRTAAVGGLLAMLVMAGAILAHLLFLGLSVRDDGGLLLALAVARGATVRRISEKCGARPVPIRIEQEKRALRHLDDSVLDASPLRVDREEDMALRSEWDHLLLAARGGDALALGQLLEVAQEDLQSVASGVLGRSAQARLPVEDVLAEAFVAVVKDIASLRATNYVGFRFWFASIARNNVRRTLRRERDRGGFSADEEPEDESAALQPNFFSAENLAFVRHALIGMPRSQQVAYVLREGLGLSWHVIGFVLERREASAARLVHYRAALRVKEVAATRPDLRPSTPVIVV